MFAFTDTIESIINDYKIVLTQAENAAQRFVEGTVTLEQLACEEEKKRIENMVIKQLTDLKSLTQKYTAYSATALIPHAQQDPIIELQRKAITEYLDGFQGSQTNILPGYTPDRLDSIFKRLTNNRNNDTLSPHTLLRIKVDGLQQLIDVFRTDIASMITTIEKGETTLNSVSKITQIEQAIKKAKVTCKISDAKIIAEKKLTPEQRNKQRDESKQLSDMMPMGQCLMGNSSQPYVSFNNFKDEYCDHLSDQSLFSTIKDLETRFSEFQSNPELTDSCSRKLPNLIKQLNELNELFKELSDPMSDEKFNRRFNLQSPLAPSQVKAIPHANALQNYHDVLSKAVKMLDLECKNAPANVGQLLKLCTQYKTRLESSRLKSHPDTVKKIQVIESLSCILNNAETSPLKKLADFRAAFNPKTNLQAILETRRDSWLTAFVRGIYKILGYKGDELNQKVNHKIEDLGRYRLFKIPGHQVTEEMTNVLTPKQP